MLSRDSRRALLLLCTLLTFTEWWSLVPGASAVAPVPEVAAAPSVGGTSTVSTVVADPTAVQPVVHQQALQALADTFNVPNTTAVVANALDALSPTTGAVHAYTLTISRVSAAPDGFNRSIIAVNGQSPGPMLTSGIGDTMQVTIQNRLNEPTSMHWHGVLQTGTNDQDGAAGVTQRPIPPGASFTYKFVTNTPGTYWYHSHVAAQYVDGCRGPIIVDGDSSDLIVQLADWYHTDSETLTAQYLSPSSMGAEPVPDNLLINGVGQNLTCTNPGSYSVTPTCKQCSGSQCSYARATVNLLVVPPCSLPIASRQRVRILNENAFGIVDFSIDGHLLGVIAADGINVQSTTVSRIRLNAAQRYDALICRQSFLPSPGPVFMRAKFVQGAFARPAAIDQTLAILRYSSSDNSIPTSTDDSGSHPGLDPLGADDIDPYNLQSNPSIRQPKADLQLNTSINFMTDASGVNRAYFNGISANIPAAIDPALPSMRELALAGKPLPPPGASFSKVLLTKGKRYQLLINNYDTGEHPIHLHGHILYILARGATGEGPWSTSAPNGRLKYKNPAGRDTISINAQSYIVLQFTANNPGVWYLHCHIDWHLENGLAMIFQYNNL